MNTFDYIDRRLPEIGAIAEAGYFLALRIRGASPLMSFHTYPQAWIDEYTSKGYVLRDPVTTWAMTVGGSIRWSSPLLPDPFGIFRRAARHGLRHGASVALGPRGALTVCSFSRRDREFTDAEIEAVRAIVADLHERTAPPAQLSPDQVALLGILAGTDAVPEVAERLGVPVQAAERAVRDLCESLLARSPGEAVQRARDYRLI
ncbi:MAG: autoinducer binding domain-containing protein [Rhodobacteraceae bacterium]|nr:autoinducer binding domain-containing protein [Paracoccaceae bacterium]